MNINEKKFVEVFVDMVEGNKIISSSSNLEERYDKCDIGEYIHQWEDFLFDKMDEMSEEEFEDWFNDITFDSIEERDLEKYHLPTDKILIESAFGQETMRKFCECVRHAYDEANSIYKSAGSPDNIWFSYSTSRSMKLITLDIALFSEKEIVTYRKMKRVFIETEKRLNAILKEFTDSQAIFSVKVESISPQSETYIDASMDEFEAEGRRQKAEKNKSMGIVNYKKIALQESLFNLKRKHQKTSHEDLINMMFANIGEEFVENKSDRRADYI